MPGIIANAEPFFMPGKAPAGERAEPRPRVGALLVHGFTATPHQLRDLGAYLAERGVSVLAPRLAGHATEARDLERTTWRDWYYDVLDAYALLRPHVDALWAVGLSLGALLCLHLAANERVEGVAALSTPLILRNQRLVQLSRALPVRYVRKRSGPPPADPNMRRYISYVTYPIRSVAELVRLQRIVTAELPQITAPALVLHSRSDELALPAGASAVYGGLGSEQRELSWIAESDHVITMDHARDEVNARLYDFMTRKGFGLEARQESPAGGADRPDDAT